MNEKNPLKKQVGGNHYNGSIELIEFFMSNTQLSWCQCSAIKYIVRFRERGGKEDLDKARHYIDLLEYFEYNENKENRKHEIMTQETLEEFIKEHSGEFNIFGIYDHFSGIIAPEKFLEEFESIMDKIAIDSEYKICWIYNPNIVKKYFVRSV